MSGYRLIDSGNFRKYEQVGPIRIIRPSAQAVWRPAQSESTWKADAEFIRTSGGDGKWHVQSKKIPDSWVVEIGGLKVVIRLTDFGHIGVFPEHHHWPLMAESIGKQVSSGRDFKLLNLFAYTGMVSLGAAKAGASVVHVDASKTSVAWGRENAAASDLDEKPIRWIVDDVQKFVQREVKRGSKYDGIVLDPPSFGRGTKGEIWKIEDHLLLLMDELSQLFSDDFSFIQLSAHSQGYTPIAMQNILEFYLGKKGGHFKAMEMTVLDEAKRPLPSGACAIWSQSLSLA